jgi:hypothetical protein
MIRFLAGDQCADILDVRPADWTAALIATGTGLADLLDRDERETLLEKAFGKIAQDVMEQVIKQQRQGKNATFRVPKSLQGTVIPNT